jgi:hypothetical protein
VQEVVGEFNRRGGAAFELRELKQRVSLEAKRLGKRHPDKPKMTLRLQEMGQKIVSNDTAFTAQKESFGISA